ncbi:MAG: anaerobic ribonucleoside-triphosphate reductase activating protein [Clostridia bacterium]|nr:anaerobic ribonucleoside-triphosphate reductase activating protein [Clostridia bacterium]
MNYATIKRNDIANGVGVRVSLFVSGCRHHCKNCFNQEAWSFSFGQPFTEQTIANIVEWLAPSYVDGLSLLGGEPFEPENQQALVELVQTVRKTYPHKSIWCYTGFVFEDILAGKVGNKQTALQLLSNVDVLVDGKFVEEQKDLSLMFRGSANQRILDVAKSLQSGTAVWMQGKWNRTRGGNIHEQ